MAQSKAASGRPLSPHLQIYRPQITSVLSILHRMTGVALAFGTLWLTWYLVALATGPDQFALVQAFSGSIIGRLLLLGFTWALVYHLLNGIRHLAWDMGWGFSLPVMARTGWLVVVFSFLLTVGAWALGYMARG